MKRLGHLRRWTLDVGMSSYVGGQISFALRRPAFDTFPP